MCTDNSFIRNTAIYHKNKNGKFCNGDLNEYRHYGGTTKHSGMCRRLLCVKCLVIC